MAVQPIIVWGVDDVLSSVSLPYTIPSGKFIHAVSSSGGQSPKVYTSGYTFARDEYITGYLVDVENNEDESPYLEDPSEVVVRASMSPINETGPSTVSVTVKAPDGFQSVVVGLPKTNIHYSDLFNMTSADTYTVTTEGGFSMNLSSDSRPDENMVGTRYSSQYVVVPVEGPLLGYTEEVTFTFMVNSQALYDGNLHNSFPFEFRIASRRNGVPYTSVSSAYISIGRLLDEYN